MGQVKKKKRSRVKLHLKSEIISCDVKEVDVTAIIKLTIANEGRQME